MRRRQPTRARKGKRRLSGSPLALSPTMYPSKPEPGALPGAAFCSTLVEMIQKIAANTAKNAVAHESADPTNSLVVKRSSSAAEAKDCEINPPKTIVKTEADARMGLFKAVGVGFA
jgi:hypothetical protein